MESVHQHDFHLYFYYAILPNKKQKATHMNSDTEKLRKKYMDNPPEGMTRKDICNMSEDDLLNMDYFLNEDDLFDDEAGVEGFYIF